MHTHLHLRGQIQILLYCDLPTQNRCRRGVGSRTHPVSRSGIHPRSILLHMHPHSGPFLDLNLDLDLNLNLRTQLMSTPLLRDRAVRTTARIAHRLRLRRYSRHPQISRRRSRSNASHPLSPSQAPPSREPPTVQTRTRTCQRGAGLRLRRRERMGTRMLVGTRKPAMSMNTNTDMGRKRRQGKACWPLRQVRRTISSRLW